MMKIHTKILEVDIPKGQKKKWYPGLEIEVKRILKLLSIDKRLPGQYPMRGFKSSLSGLIQHARINLPKTNCGKSDGPRVVYMIKNGGIECCNGNPEIAVLYVGGHKDKKYNKDDAIVSEVILRIAENDFIDYEEYLKI